MKKLIAICIVALMAAVSTPSAKAYNELAAQMAEMMNEEAASEGATVKYDGKDIIMTFPQSFLSAENRETLKGADVQTLNKYMKEAVTSEWDDETKSIISQVLVMADANIIIRVDLGNGKVASVRISPNNITK